MAAMNLNPLPAGMENIQDYCALLIRNIAVSIRSCETQTDEILLNKNTYGKTVETQTESDMLLGKTFCGVAMQTDNFLEWRRKSNDNTEVLIGQFLHDDSNYRDSGKLIQDSYSADDSDDDDEEEEDYDCYDNSNGDILDADGSKIEIEIVNDMEDEESMVINDTGGTNELQSEQQSEQCDGQQCRQYNGQQSVNWTPTHVNNPSYNTGIGGISWPQNPNYINSTGEKNGHESLCSSENQSDLTQNACRVQDKTLELIEKKLTVQSNSTKKHQTHVLKFSKESTRSTVEQTAAVDSSSVWQQIIHIGREEEIQLEGSKRGTASLSKVVPIHPDDSIKQQAGGSKKAKLKRRLISNFNTQKSGQISEINTNKENTEVLNKQNDGIFEKKNQEGSLDTLKDPEKNQHEERENKEHEGEVLVSLPGPDGELVVSLKSKLSKNNQVKHSSDAVTETSKSLAGKDSETDHSYSLSRSSLQNNNMCNDIYSSEDDIDDGQDCVQESETDQIISSCQAPNKKKNTVLNQKQAKSIGREQKNTNTPLKIKKCSVPLTPVEQKTFKVNTGTVTKYFVEYEEITQTCLAPSLPSKNWTSSQSDSDNVALSSVNHPHRTRSKIKLDNPEFLEIHKAPSLTPKRKPEDRIEDSNKKKIQIYEKYVKELKNNRKHALACPVCSKFMASDYKLTIHMKKHERKKFYPCQICHQKFKASDNLRRHMALHNRTPNYECEICQRPFAIQSGLMLHMASHSNVVLSCPYCAKQCKGRNGLHTHLGQFHNTRGIVSVEDEEESKTGKKKYGTRTKTGTINVINYRDKLNLKLNDTSAKKLRGPNIDALTHEGSLSIGCEDCDDNESSTDNSLQNAEVSQTSVHKELNESGGENIATLSYVTTELLPEQVEVKSESDTVTDVISGQIIEKEGRILSLTFGQKKEQSESNEAQNSFPKYREPFVGKAEHFVTKELNADTEPKCDGCGEIFPNLNLLINHLNKFQNNPKNQCYKCKKIFSEKRNLRRHIKRCIHKIREVRPVYPCEICKNVFHRKVNLKRHIERCINKTVKPGPVHTCEKCQKVFPRKTNLRRHQKICLQANSEKPRPHRRKVVEDGETPCPACGKVLKSRLRMKIHYKNIHSGRPKPNRSQKCQLCGIILASKRNLNVHMQIHRGIKNFLCSVCGQKFRLKSSLSKHMGIHTGVKKIPKYPCEICGKMFRCKYNKKIHLMSHTGEKPFQCHACGQQFRTNAFLNTHRRNIHHEAIPNCNLDRLSYHSYVTQNLQESDFMSKDYHLVSNANHTLSEGSKVNSNSLDSLEVLKGNQMVAMVTDGTKDNQLVSLIDGSKYNNLVSLVDNLPTEHSQVGVSDDGSIYQYVVIENPHSSNETSTVMIEDGTLAFEEETDCAVVTIMNYDKV